MKNERLYTEVELVSFGNYLLSEKREQNITVKDNLRAVHEKDIANWREAVSPECAPGCGEKGEAETSARSIKAGDRVRIKKNLPDELARLRFDAPHGMDCMIGKTLPVLDVYDDCGEVYITVDVCAEIPIAACEKVENKQPNK